MQMYGIIGWFNCKFGIFAFCKHGVTGCLVNMRKTSQQIYNVPTASVLVLYPSCSRKPFILVLNYDTNKYPFLFLIAVVGFGKKRGPNSSEK